MKELGIAALTLAQDFGLSVFPLLDRDKRPRLPGGFHLATTVGEQIAAWWRRWPLANIGLYPGASQLLVLDVDGPAGEETARAWGAYDVETVEVATRRGVHRYYGLPDGIRIGNVARHNLDIRAHNGYVLAPPSVHPEGHVYAWRRDIAHVAPIPGRLLRAIMQGPRPVAKRRPIPQATRFNSMAERRILAYADRVGYGLADGRKSAAFRFAAFLAHDLKLADHEAAQLLETWNTYNVPPLASEKLATILANARRYGGRSECSGHAQRCGSQRNNYAPRVPTSRRCGPNLSVASGSRTSGTHSAS